MAPAGSSTSSSPGCAAPAPAGPLTVRVDSGFWSNDTIATLNRLDVRYTMAVRSHTTAIAAAIAAIADDAWVDIDYTPDGQAQVADTAYTTGTGRRRVTRRLVVRRTRLTDPAQQRLWPDWRHHGFLTDLDGDAVTVDAFHRRHAVVELAIRDLKAGAGLDHVPSGNFHANSAWLQCVVLAHNLIRWTAILGNVRVDDELTVARTMRTRLIAIPGRLVNRSGVPTLRLPTRWPWRDVFNRRAAATARPRPRPRIAATPAGRRPAHPPPSADNSNRSHHADLATPHHRPPRARRPPIGPQPTTRPASRRYDDRANPIGGSRLKASVLVSDDSGNAGGAGPASW